jgi:hypothetical protein
MCAHLEFWEGEAPLSREPGARAVFLRSVTAKRNDLIATYSFNPKTKSQANRRPADFFKRRGTQPAHLEPGCAHNLQKNVCAPSISHGVFNSQT